MELGIHGKPPLPIPQSGKTRIGSRNRGIFDFQMPIANTPKGLHPMVVRGQPTPKGLHPIAQGIVPSRDDTLGQEGPLIHRTPKRVPQSYCDPGIRNPEPWNLLPGELWTTEWPTNE